MNKIKLNNTEFEITSYSKNLSISEGNINESGYCELFSPDAEDLNALINVPITTIQIYYNSLLIYELNNISAHIVSINEYLSMDHMNVNMNLIFDTEENL